MSIRLRNPISMLRSVQYGLDAGTANTLITNVTGDVLLDEPTVIAFDQDAKAPIATGTEAKSYLGKAPERISVVRPIDAGVIVDFEAAKALLRTFLSRVLEGNGARVKLCVVVPLGVTELERRTFEDCCKAAGASKVLLLSAPLAAAIGSGLDIRASKGRLLLGIGAGLAEASVLCLSDIVLSQSAPLGANAFHIAMMRYFAATRQVAIGENMAEQTTINLASATPPALASGGRIMTVTGKQSMTGTPCAEEMKEADLAGALAEPLQALVDLVRGVLEKAPAELVADIAETGIHLYGGGAALQGLPEFFEATLKLKTRIAEEPRTASVRGAAAVLRPDLDFKNIIKK